MSAAYTLRAAGTTDSGTSVTAGAPAGVVAGDLLLHAIVSRNNADTFSAPSGWTAIYPAVNAAFVAVFARIATGSGDAPATLSSSGVSQCVTQAAAFYGNVWTGGLGSIIHASVDQTGAGAGGGGNGIQYSALTISVDNTLAIAVGGHNKTATSNGSSVDALSGFTQIGQLAPNGSSLRFYWGYQQQTTATNLSSVVQTCSGTVEALQQQSLYLSLKTSNTVAPKAVFIARQMRGS